MTTGTRELRGSGDRPTLGRIAFLDGGCPIGSQGVVKYVSLVRPNAVVVAFFARAETEPLGMSPGFRARQPILNVPYGWAKVGDKTDFTKQLQVKHATAILKFGTSKIDNPQATLDAEIAKWIPGPGLAQNIGEPLVRALGCGMIIWRFRSIIPHPELDIGDPVAVETDRFTVRNPNTGDPIAGVIWGIGRIIEKRDLWGREFGVWIRSYADLFATSSTVQGRAPVGVPLIQASVMSITGQPQNAQVRLSVFPAAATIWYFYAAASIAPPDQTSDLWLPYTGTVTVARDAANDMLFSFFGSINNINGPVLSERVPPSAKASIGALSAVETGASPNITVTVTGSAPSELTKSIRYYARKHTAGSFWPTVDGTATGIPRETYFIAELGVDPSWGGILASGATTPGGLVPITIANNFSTAGPDHLYVVAVPLDAFNNAGTRQTMDYTVVGTATPTLTTAAVALHTAGSAGPPIVNRTYDFSWTSVNVVDVTHHLNIYITINGVRSLYVTETHPNSVSAANNVDTLYYPKALSPDIATACDWEIRDGSNNLLSSGVFSPNPFETYQGKVNA